jgi:virulence factor Mce-like protein
MQKNPPSLFRILSMVVFALSCIGLLLFLWLSFGGSIPLKPKSYELKVNFPEATTLAEQADVRIAGVTVGKVQKKQLFKGANSTNVTLQIQPKFAPIPKDTRAILRQKTLLGETYVELTPGNRRAGTLKDGATLADRQVEPTVELDEILQIFDPQTKDAFRQWVAESAQSIKNGGGQDLNSALGNLGEFAQNGAGVLSVLDNQSTALRSVVKNTGVVFAALNQRYGQLHDLILNSNATFSATAAEQQALARTFDIFPTFLDESRLTLVRLERFAINTDPLVRLLRPVADNLGPTVRDLGNAGPDLENLFRRLVPVINAAPHDLPQASRFLRGASPLFDALHVFLPQLNPILSYANWNSEALGGFIGDGTSGTDHPLPRTPDQPGVPRYALGQAGTINSMSLGLFQTRPQFDRGNAYQANNALRRGEGLGVIESFDCRPDHPDGNGTTDQIARRDPVDTTTTDLPPCFVQPPQLWSSHHQRYPRLDKGEAPLNPPPFNITPPAMPPGF